MDNLNGTGVALMDRDTSNQRKNGESKRKKGEVKPHSESRAESVTADENVISEPA